MAKRHRILRFHKPYDVLTKFTDAEGRPTLRLIRVSHGPIKLAGLQPGDWRDLTDEER